MAEEEGFEERPRRRRPDPDDDDDRPRRRRDPDDDDDDRPRRRRRESSGPSDGGVGYIIPYKNGAALASYYIGILCLLLCFVPGLSLFSGAAAVVFGFMGMSRASKNPEAHGRGHAITGIILGIVQILASCVSGGFLILGLLGKLK
jgi:Domain of unknown function (DUF4190)